MAIQYGPRSLPIPNTRASGFAPAFAPRAQVASSRRPVSQTTAQVANQRVNQQLNPQIAAQNTFNQHQNAVIQSFANALLGKLQPIAGQVGQAYDSAIQQTGALGQGAAQFLNAQNPSGPVAELLKQAGAPQSQTDQLTGQFGQTFGGGAGVLAYTGGAIPGGQLAADKAAAVGEAAQLPGFAALKGQQDLSSALWQQGQDRRSLLATRPGLLQQATQDIRTNQNARAKLAQTAQQNATSNRLKADTLNQNWAKFKIQEGDSRAAAAEKTRQFNAKLDSENAKAVVNSYVQLTKLGYTKEQIDLQLSKLTSDQAAEKKRLQIAQQNANTSQQNANTSATRADNAAKIAAYKAANPTVKTRTIKVAGGTALVNSETGAVIKTFKGPTTATAASGGKFSNSDVASLAGDVRSWHTGVTGTANGQPVVDPNSQLSWNDAYKRALTRLPGTPAGRAKALSVVNAEYGTPESIASIHAQNDVRNKVSMTDSIKGFLAANSVPTDAAVAATARAYKAKPSDVRAVISQLQKMASTGG